MACSVSLCGQLWLRLTKTLSQWMTWFAKSITVLKWLALSILPLVVTIPLSKLQLTAKKSRHWGTYDNPLNEIKKQFNSLFEVTYAPQQLKGWSFTVSGAMDRGNLLGNNYGGMLVIRKQGIIKSGNK